MIYFGRKSSKSVFRRTLLHARCWCLNLPRSDRRMLQKATESEPPIALAAFNLSTDGFFVRDGEHRIRVRRIEQGLSLEQQLATYLGEDNTPPASSDSALCVDTFLCSTRFTEDNTLHSLLHWKQDIGTLATEESKFKMKEILRKFTFVSEIEVLKVFFVVSFLTVVFA